jgi:hypothetical protein
VSGGRDASASDRPPTGARKEAAPPLRLLQRVLQERAPAPGGERCDMCAAPVAEEHPHVVDLESRSLLCTCRPCALLFTTPGAATSTGGVRYRTVPDRTLSFPAFTLTAGQWDDLQVPVGMVFFFRNSRLDRTVAVYPGPAGATESELPLQAWDEVVAANPALATMEPDVEAVLVRSVRGPDGNVLECYLVPIDRCYELVGLMRRSWRGFDGGREAHEQLRLFFDDVRARSRPAPCGAFGGPG